MSASITFPVTIFRNVAAKAFKEHAFTLETLSRMCFVARGSKAACELLKLARFGDTKTADGCLRHDDNVREVWGVEVDYDAEVIGFNDARDRLQCAGIACVIYTSPSYTNEKPRWRVLAPTSRAITRDERRSFCDRLNGLFDGAVAPESWTLSQSYYFGRTSVRFRCEIVEGAAIDRCDLSHITPIPGGKATKQGNGKGANGGATDWIRSIRDHKGWHNAVRDLVARKVALGESDDEIMLIAEGVKWDGYSIEQTRDEMGEFIRSARAKGFDRRRTDRPCSDEKTAETADLELPSDPKPIFWPTLPEAFWDMRPLFKRVRTYAWSRYTSGDAAFFATLARFSAMAPADFFIDTGVGSPTKLNLFTALVSPSGGGKSTSAAVSKIIVPAHDNVVDDRPVGSGEGVAEAFMGEVQLDVDGKPERSQVRHNAVFYIGEGEALTQLSRRTGSTLGETLRRAFSCETLGQTNASKDLTRRVVNYSIAFIINMTPGIAGQILSSHETGTPQRLLWGSAIDCNIPRNPQRCVDEPKIKWDFNIGEVFFSPEVRGGIGDIAHAQSTGAITPDPLDGHELRDARTDERLEGPHPAGRQLQHRLHHQHDPGHRRTNPFVARDRHATAVVVGVRHRLQYPEEPAEMRRRAEDQVGLQHRRGVLQPEVRGASVTSHMHRAPVRSPLTLSTATLC